MKVYLKMKIMSLATEARIIRAEEKKWPGEHAARIGLHEHRIRGVRPEARHALLAYGFLRGRAYRTLEAAPARPPNWERVGQLIEKFGDGDVRALRERFAAWQEARKR